MGKSLGHRLLDNAAFVAGAGIGFAFLGVSFILTATERAYNFAAGAFAISPRRPG